MRSDQVHALLSPAGRAALDRAARLVPEPQARDPLAAAAALRRTGVDPDLAAAALTQAELRARAAGKFGPDAARMLFTRPGLEQATRSAVATRRAARLRASGAATVADLGCGIGSDTLAFARAGLRVTAYDSDPAAAAIAAANADALGLADRIEVRCAGAGTADLSGVDAVFCDPSRRRAGTGRRVLHPAGYSPSWDFVTALAQRVPRTVLKLAPGIDLGLLPAGSEAEFVSVDGDLVEAAVWCGPLAGVPRRATLLRAGGGAAGYGLTGTGGRAAPVGPVGDTLYDPDGAVIRAGLVAEFAALVSGHLADPTIAYVHATGGPPSPLGRRLGVQDVLPFSVKRVRAELRRRGVGRLTIRKRGSALDVQRLRAELRLSGPAEATLVLTRVAGAHVALVCQEPATRP